MALRFADHEFAGSSELRWHPEAKRIRAAAGGRTVIDSTRARVVWEPRRVVPSFAVPTDDLDASLVATDAEPADGGPAATGDESGALFPGTGFTVHTTAGSSLDISTGETTLPAAAFEPADADFDGYVIVDFDAFDEWREEDEVLVGHARDPFKTVDTRHSARRVTVDIAGVTVADSTSSVMLFETYLPTRYYLPREDVRMDLLTPSPSTSVCAYKGRARYWSARVGDTDVPNVAWSYEVPDNYATAVKDLICFYNERVDISVDGERMARPRSPWSADENLTR
jgi:uncharacterized protein (DUF427 family)